MLGQKSGNNRREERPQIYSGVKDRKAGVPSLISLPVQLANHRADIRFEQPGPAGDQNQTTVESRKRVNRHRIMTAGDNDSADKDSPPCAKNLIRKPATD